MQPVSLFEAVELIRAWGRLFDAHASPHTAMGIVAGEDFVIRFGEMTLKGLAGLEEHHSLKEMFFREMHHYYDFQVESDGPPRVMRSQMVWDTHRHASDGSEEHLIADIRHRWTFTRMPDGRPAVLEHELISLDYRPGYEPSESDGDNLHIDPDRVGFGKENR